MNDAYLIDRENNHDEREQHEQAYRSAQAPSSALSLKQAAEAAYATLRGFVEELEEGDGNIRPYRDELPRCRKELRALRAALDDFSASRSNAEPAGSKPSSGDRLCQACDGAGLEIVTIFGYDVGVCCPRCLGRGVEPDDAERPGSSLFSPPVPSQQLEGRR